MRCENKKFVIGWTNGGIQIDRSLWGLFLCLELADLLVTS